MIILESDTVPPPLLLFPRPPGALTGVWKSIFQRFPVRQIRYGTEMAAYIYIYIYEKRGDATLSVPPSLPPSPRPSTEMRQVIVFDAAMDGENTLFENRCLRRYDVTRGRSNLVTLRFTLVVMAEWGDTEKRKVGGLGRLGGSTLEM